MHEIGIVNQMVKTVLDYTEESKIAPADVAEIIMQVGELSLVIPEYLEELYPVVIAQSELKNAKLVIEIIPGMAECDDCDAIFNVVECEGLCPDCASDRKTVLTGLDCTIKEIHILGEQ